MFAQRPPLRRGGSCRGSRGGRPMVAPTFTAGTAIKFVGADILARQSLRRRRRHHPLHKGGYPLRRGRADEYPQGAGRICNAPSSRTAALGIGPYIFYRRFSDFHTPQVQSKALVGGGAGEPFERFPCRLFPFLIGTERRPSTAVGFREGRRRLRIWSFRRPGGSAMQQASSDVAAAHLLTYASRYISECQVPEDPSPAPDPPA